MSVWHLRFLKVAVATLLTAHSILVAAQQAPLTTSDDSVTPESFAASEFDVLIVGGGTAGVVVANRLSASSLRVGLIEAGHFSPSGDPIIDIPNTNSASIFSHVEEGMLIGNPKYDWNLKSVPQAALDGLVLGYPRGKVLGGSSVLNAMAWQRGPKIEYDAWGSEFGNGDEWTWDGLLPYFKRLETWTPPPTGPNALSADANPDPSVHGTDGPIAASHNNYFTDLDKPLLQASVTLGFPLNDDPEAGVSTYLPRSGITHSVDPVSGNRSYAAAYYSEEVRARKNLVLLTNAIVTEIIWDKSTIGSKSLTATGVQYTSGGKTFVVKAKKEVILCAGSLQSPQLLELSGVGNATLLKDLDIPVVLDFPEIGENLIDHPISLSDFRVKDGVVTLDQFNFNETYVAEHKRLYETSHTGALTYTAQITGSLPLQAVVSPSEFQRMRKQLDETLSKLQLTPIQQVQFNLLKKWIDRGDFGILTPTMLPRGGLASTPEKGKSYLSVAVFHLHEFGRGTVHITTKDPLVTPAIDPKYLSNPWDVDCQVHGTRWLRKWVTTEPVNSLIDGPLTPPASVQSHEDWSKFVKSKLMTVHHPMGTTAMAPKSLGGVVDPRLKIYGISNVRVVDAGIIPMSVGVPIQSTVYALAEKGAQMIIDDLTNPSSKPKATHTEL